MRITTNLVLSTFVAFVFSSNVMGAIGNITIDAYTFGKGGVSVIIANVRAIAPIKDDPGGRDLVTLEPLAVLAGEFNAADHPKLPVRLYMGTGGSSVEEMPRVGAMVITVIVLAPVHGDVDNLAMAVETSYCDFMPRLSGMVMIDGLGDKRVMETIESIRAALKSAKK